MSIRVAGSAPGLAGSRAMGAIFLAGFGSLWLWLGAVSAGHGSPWTLLAILAPAACYILLALKLRRLAPDLAGQTRARPTMRVFIGVNILQYLLIAAAVLTSIRLGREDYLPAAIALIVGLHFVPLAWLFRTRAQYVTAAAMVAAALLLRAHSVAVCFAAGAILWATAAWHLLQSARDVRIAPQARA